MHCWRDFFFIILLKILLDYFHFYLIIIYDFYQGLDHNCWGGFFQSLSPKRTCLDPQENMPRPDVWEVSPILRGSEMPGLRREGLGSSSPLAARWETSDPHKLGIRFRIEWWDATQGAQKTILTKVNENTLYRRDGTLKHHQGITLH